MPTALRTLLPALGSAGGAIGTAPGAIIPSAAPPTNAVVSGVGAPSTGLDLGGGRQYGTGLPRDLMAPAPAAGGGLMQLVMNRLRQNNGGQPGAPSGASTLI